MQANLAGTIFAENYKLEKLIGEGAFGKIYSAKCMDTQEEVAVKLEALGRKRSQLLEEAKVYRLFQGKEGIPKLYKQSTEGGYHGIVIELLGPNLESLMALCGRRFTLPTVLAIGEQTVERVEAFHSKGILHRDIKPENFNVGRGDKASIVYIIDYGLAKRYRNSRNKSHIPFKQNKRLAGTARYSSINTHMGYEQSRRDDLECLGYSLLYLARGDLPWQGIKAETKKEKYDKIMEKKNDTPVEVLCKGLPAEFVTYIYYCRNLQFEDKPDYSQLRKLFREAFHRSLRDKDFSFDWIRLGVDLTSCKKQVTGDDSNKADCEQHDEPKAPKGKGLKKPGSDDNLKVISSPGTGGNEEPPGVRPMSRSLRKAIPELKPEMVDDQTPTKELNEIGISPVVDESKERAHESEDLSKKSPNKSTAVKVEEEKVAVIDPKSKRLSEIQKLAENIPKIAKYSAEEQPPLRNSFADRVQDMIGKQPEKMPKEVATVTAAAAKDTAAVKGTKDIPIQLYRKITRELSDHSSCNFNIRDTIESNLFVDDAIPTENPMNTHIGVPLCTYIHNEKHWRTFRSNRGRRALEKQLLSAKKSSTSHMHLSVSPLRTQHTGQSCQMPQSC